jgi:DNA-directed RNA polymerase subunit beta
MYSLPKNVYRERIDFSKIKTTIPIPNLIEIQKKSYERFLQMNRLPSEREDAGLQSVFKSVFPISDFRENSSLEFIEYSIGNWECKCGRLAGLHHLRKPCVNCGHTLVADPYGEHDVLCPRCGKPNEARGDVCDICGNTVGLKLKYDVDECQERGMTYAVPLKVTIRLVVWNKDPETGVKTIRDIKEQEVYFGDIPLMTDNGTFIINGTERVIVSQLHRSPGAFFHSKTRRSTSRRSSRIAARGWSSSTTPRTCSTSASTASGSSSPRCSCAPSGCAAPTRSSAASTRSTS